MKHPAGMPPTAPWDVPSPVDDGDEEGVPPPRAAARLTGSRNGRRSAELAGNGLNARVSASLRPYFPAAALALVCLAGQAVLGLAPAVVLRALIDYLVEPGARFGHVGLLVAAVVGAAVAGGLLGLAHASLSERVGRGVASDLRQQLFARLVREPAGSSGWRTNGMATCLDGEVDEVRTAVARTAFGLARDGLVALTTVILMLALDWHLALLALGLLGLATLSMRGAGRAVHRAHGRARTKLGELTAYLQEVLGPRGSLVVKAFAGERAEEARFRTLNHELSALEVQAAMVTRRFAALAAVLEAAAPALLVLAGGYLVISDRTSVGTVFVFAALLMPRLGGAVGGLRDAEAHATRALALFRRVFAAIDHEPDVADLPGARPLRNPRGAVWLDRVTFAYPGQARPALHDFSAVIEPGQLVALVGPPGAGKRTVAALLPRFCDPQRGTVRIDGRDVRELTLDSVRRTVATIFPETFLFNTTIRENLRYARPEASEAQLVAAARAAYLHHFICTLPEGYDTVVGGRGRGLSAGELRRMGIARAILRDPRILILHEHAGEVDNVSEHLVQAAIAPLFAGRTCLVITDRPATLRAADTILLLDEGRLIDQGAHYELLERSALYGSLVDDYPRAARPAPAGFAWR